MPGLLDFTGGTGGGLFGDMFKRAADQPQQSAPMDLHNLFKRRDTYNDQPSLPQLLMMHQRMLQQRAATQIPTIDPGRTWGGLDPLAFDPADIQSYRTSRDRIPERI